MLKRLFVFISIVSSGFLFFQPNLLAAGSGGGTKNLDASSASANYQKGKKAVDSQNYRKAIDFLSKADRETPNDADINNLLGYSHRKVGEFKSSLAYYKRALAINPNHRGANEYIGELYLQTGNIEKAEAHLKVLDKVCLWGCEEYNDLKEAITQYKKRNK
jgi:tetratricopeptide (TPR) repeat protein